MAFVFQQSIRRHQMTATISTPANETTVSALATFEQRAKFNSIYRYIALSGAEITDDTMAAMDREARLDWIATAHIYARLYRGESGFMQKMRQVAEFGGVLTVRQARAVLNQIHRDGAAVLQKRGVPKAVAPVAPLAPRPAPPKPMAERKNGYYTVGLADGTTVTIRLEDDFRDDAPDGAQMASYLYGPANEHDYAGFAFVNVTGIRVWRSAGDVKRQREALEMLFAATEDEAKAMGMTYCQEVGRCCVCGRTLTVKGSIEAGIGPVCARKWGMA
jgi:hypothetical protein